MAHRIASCRSHASRTVVVIALAGVSCSPLQSVQPDGSFDPGDSESGIDAAIQVDGGPDRGDVHDVSADGSPPIDAPTLLDGSVDDGSVVLLPALTVQGNQIMRSGNAFRLIGVNHSGAEYMCVRRGGVWDGPADDATIAAIASWHVNSVRVPLNEDCWLDINGVAVGGVAYQNAIVDFVTRLNAHGLYAVLDLHWSAPGTYLATGQQPMADFDHALTFWTSVAGTFGPNPGVLFDLFNEPFVDTTNTSPADPWACWLHGCTITSSPGITESWRSAGVQDLLDAVRATGANNVVLAGGIAWANDLTGWLSHRPSDPTGNLAASYHTYNFNACSSLACWTTQLQPVVTAVPVVTGEIGEHDCQHTYIDSYMAWADAQGVSYMAWTWNTWTDCTSNSILIGDWMGTPTVEGEGFRDHVRTLFP